MSILPFELQAPENADGQLNQLEKMILSLEEMPNAFDDMRKNHGAVKGFVSFLWIITLWCIFLK